MFWAARRLKSGTLSRTNLLLGCSSCFGGFSGSCGGFVSDFFGGVHSASDGCSADGGCCGCGVSRCCWCSSVSRCGGRCCWLNRSSGGSSLLHSRSGRRHRRFFLFTASGQDESGEQAGEQNGLFHDDFPKNGVKTGANKPLGRWLDNEGQHPDLRWPSQIFGNHGIRLRR